MRHDVVDLRTVAAPVGREWMTLADAEAAGIPLDHVRDGIGPRARGMVYRGGYANDVSTVHEVFVEIRQGDRDYATGAFLPVRAAYWLVAEESADDYGRVRRHCTSWTYNDRNQPLFMIGDRPDTSGSCRAVPAG